jgi:hypothetical protein
MMSVTKIVVTVEALFIGVYQYQEVLNPLYWRHMCEVHLPIHSRETSPGLVGRKGRGPNIGVGVCVLAN